MKKIFSLTQFAVLAAYLILVQSCKPKDEEPQYEIPTTYNYMNVNYSGQTYRLMMLQEMISYMNTARVQGTVISSTNLDNMFSNTGSPFSDSVLNNSGKQLRNKCYDLDRTVIESYIDSITAASQSLTAGSNGIAGIVTSSSDPSKKYVLGANGFDYTEMIEKGLMGAIFYYQAVNIYLENISVDDNNTVTIGEGTVMEHHFDEAFGYFGVPKDFPTNNTDVVFWGEYCNDLNAVLGCNAKLMNAFLAGRAAISNKDYSTRDEKIIVIRENWDALIAAAAIHEINESIQYFSDDAVRNHTLSEFLGFVYSLKYNIHAKITSAQITEVTSHIGTNLYMVTVNDLNAAKNSLSAIYDLNNIKDSL
jgi:hypothetical protein